MLSKLKQIFWQEQFQPGLIGLFINPFYFARKGLYNQIKSFAPLVKGEVLDVGCGRKPYEHLFQSTKYVGLEIDSIAARSNKKADHFYDGTVFPFQANQFDSVIVSQVFEHVFQPDGFLEEVDRVLKPEGTLLMTVPFVWDEHEQPYDYARYSSFGLKSILEKHGFVILEQRKTMADIRVIFQLINVYFYKKTLTRNSYANFLITLLFAAPVNIIGELFARILPKNEDLYIDNIILARKVRQDD